MRDLINSEEIKAKQGGVRRRENIVASLQSQLFYHLGSRNISSPNESIKFIKENVKDEMKSNFLNLHFNIQFKWLEYFARFLKKNLHPAEVNLHFPSREIRFVSNP